MGPLITAAGLGSLAVWAVRGRSSPVFGRSVWRGPRGRRAMALTFDDGPSPGTADLLSFLDARRARATFFFCGANARRHASLAAETAAAGHEIGNHTENHAELWLRSRAFVRDEIARAQQSIAALSGIEPRLFRPPYGVRWFGLRSALREFDLTNVMWTAIARDWRLQPRAIVRRMIGAAHNGAILCLHDGRETRANPDIRNTIDAVRDFVPRLQDDGWELLTVGALLESV